MPPVGSFTISSANRRAEARKSPTNSADEAEKKVARDRILQAPEGAMIFALACAMWIMKWYKVDPTIRNDLAG